MASPPRRSLPGRRQLRHRGAPGARRPPRPLCRGHRRLSSPPHPSPKPKGCPSSSPAELVSAVDLYHCGAPLLSRVVLPKRPRDGQEAPVVPNEVILDHILTRVPAAATIRFQAVCRDWRAALTSDHFAQAHQTVRAAAAHLPEIVFFAPAATASSTSFYSCSVKSTTPQNGSSSPAAARELVTVVNLRAKDLVLPSTKPCRGLTLLFQPGESGRRRRRGRGLGPPHGGDEIDPGRRRRRGRGPGLRVGEHHAGRRRRRGRGLA